MTTVSLQQAIYEASLFTQSNGEVRYDIDHILIEQNKVVATDGKRLYISNIESAPRTGLIKRATIKKGPHLFPRPKKKDIGKGYKLLAESNGDYLDILGTRFIFANGDINFPPYEKVIPQSDDIVFLDKPNLVENFKALYRHGKEKAQEHLYATGDKVAPHYQAILYKNGSLHLVSECRIDSATSLPVFHSTLAEIAGGDLQDKTTIVFDPCLYPLKESPIAISLITTGPVIFYLPGRKILLMPIVGLQKPLEKIEDFLCWESFSMA